MLCAVRIEPYGDGGGGGGDVMEASDFKNDLHTDILHFIRAHMDGGCRLYANQTWE